MQGQEFFRVQQSKRKWLGVVGCWHNSSCSTKTPLCKIYQKRYTCNKYRKSHKLLVQFWIYRHSWCFESSQIALAVLFQSNVRAHKSRVYTISSSLRFLKTRQLVPVPAHHRDTTWKHKHATWVSKWPRHQSLCCCSFCTFLKDFRTEFKLNLSLYYCVPVLSPCQRWGFPACLVFHGCSKYSSLVCWIEFPHYGCGCSCRSLVWRFAAASLGF